MEQHRVERRLAAILAADVSGYSRLMGRAEAATARAMLAHREAIVPIVAGHGGRIVKTTGDGVLLEFASVVAAVECAIAVQNLMAERNASLDDEERMLFRIGINLGDILVEGDDILGDGVNIAARLESIAEPGGICLSRAAYEQCRKKVAARFIDLGEQRLKNIAEPVAVYAISFETAGAEATHALLRERTLAKSSVGRLSLLLVPFISLSGDPDHERFAAGITEVLTTDLSRELGRTAVWRPTAPLDLPRISRELGPRYVLKGAVQQRGGRIRVSVQLIDAATNEHLWTERFDKDYGDLFETQDEISGLISRALAQRIGEAELRRERREGQQSMTSHEYLTRGWSHFYRGASRENFSAARQSFAEATLHYGDTASVLAAAALINALLVLFGWSVSFAEDLKQAADLADRALAIDPKNITVLQATAFVLCAQGRATEAVPVFERTLEETPNNAGSYSNVAFALLHAGKEQGAIDLLRKAIRLSPHDPFIDLFHLNLGLANLHLGHINEAIEQLQRSVNWNPRLDFAYLMLASACALGDRMSEARAATAKALALSQDWTVTKLKAASPSWLAAIDQGLRKAGLPR